MEPSNGRRKSLVDVPPAELRGVVKRLVQHKIVNHDPLRSLTENWLLNGAPKRGVGDDDLEDSPTHASHDDDPDYQQRLWDKLDFQEQEDARIHRLASNSKGHLPWLRGRGRCSELLPATLMLAEDRSGYCRYKRRPAKLGQSASAPSVSSSSTPGKVDRTKEVWFRVADPIARLEGFLDATWCWHEDIVYQAKCDAQAINMTLPCIDIASAYQAIRHDPSVKAALERHYVAVATDGRREFWSPSFVQVLDAIRARLRSTKNKPQDGKMMQEEVRMSEEELKKISPNATFAEPALPAEGRKHAKLPVPDTALINYYGQDGPPPLPALPNRMPYNVCYKHSLPWTQLNWRPPASGLWHDWAVDYGGDAEVGEIATRSASSSDSFGSSRARATSPAVRSSASGKSGLYPLSPGVSSEGVISDSFDLSAGRARFASPKADVRLSFDDNDSGDSPEPDTTFRPKQQESRPFLASSTKSMTSQSSVTMTPQKSALRSKNSSSHARASDDGNSTGGSAAPKAVRFG